MNLPALRQSLADGRLEWRKHVLQRLAERGLRQRAVIEILLTGEQIEDYTDDKPFPSALILGYVDGKPLHVVAALDETSQWAYVITAYEPSREVFEADHRTRRRNQNQ